MLVIYRLYRYAGSDFGMESAVQLTGTAFFI